MVLSTTILLYGCADNQSRSQISDTNTRLSQLETNIGVLDNKVSNQKVIDTLNKLNSLQSQIDQLNGNIATMGNNQQKNQDVQDQLFKSINQQLQDLRNQITAPATTAKPTSAANNDDTADVANDDTSNTPTTTDNNNVSDSDSLNTAIKQVKQHHFADAIQILKSLIAGSHNTTILAKANYYLSLSYVGNGDYKNGITQGRKFITNYPHNANVPDALLTIYIAQNQMGWATSAHKTKTLLLKQYPHSKAANKLQTLANDH